MSLKTILVLIPLLPLLAAAVAGLMRKPIGRAGAHWVTILGVAVSFGLSAYVLYLQVAENLGIQNLTVYTWMVSDGIRFEVGFLRETG